MFDEELYAKKSWDFWGWTPNIGIEAPWTFDPQLPLQMFAYRRFLRAGTLREIECSHQVLSFCSTDGSFS